MARVLLACLLVLGSAHARGRAQAPDPGRDLSFIESTERDEDPLGLDESTRDLARAAAALPSPREVLPSAQTGAALSAISGVRELRHAVHVALDHGLATVTTRLSFTSTAKHAAEIAYRLPLPASAVVTRVRSCRPECGDDPALSALAIDDERGHALALRVGPIRSAFEVEVAYVAEAPLHGGRVRFHLEGRGYDPNLAPSELTVTSSTLALEPAPTRLDPWLAIELVGTLRQRDRFDERTPCGRGMCTRHYEATPLRAGPVKPTYLYIDASPSMEGPARSRLTPALAALLAVLPEQTPVHAFAFATDARELGRFRAGDAPLVELSNAALLELGASTRLATIDVRNGARIVVLSDGWFDDARKLGGDSWLVRLGGHASAPSFAHVLDVSGEAEAALHGDLSALEDRLRALVAAGSGEQRVVEHSPKAMFTPSAGASWLAYRASPRSYVRTARLDAIEAVPFQASPPPMPPRDTSMPKESVLTMLRSQLIPQARACLRADRKGRADYAVALTFHALFAQREIYEPRIDGNIPEPLRRCLMDVLPKLRVPAFTGRIRVRYPIFTEREAVEPALELEPETSQKLERAFGGVHALP